MNKTQVNARVGATIAALSAAFFLALALPAQAPQSGSGVAVLHPSEQERSPGALVLRPADYRPYVDTFQQQEREATGKLYQGEGGEDSWAWMLREIP